MFNMKEADKTFTHETGVTASCFLLRRLQNLDDVTTTQSFEEFVDEIMCEYQQALTDDDNDDCKDED
jgi:hypothetical protein